MSVESITCPNCGASLVVNPGQSLVTCTYCKSNLLVSTEAGSSAPVPRVVESPAPSGSSFRMTVEDVFVIRGRGTVVTGRIASGALHVGDRVTIRRGNKTRTVTVNGLEMFRKVLDQAKAGDNVGVLFKELTRDDVQRGDDLEA